MSGLIIPAHIAVIMDGNGRWAQNHNLPRSEGHRRGADAIDNLMESALELEIPVVSMYAFSTENWKRPVSEVTSIFKLLVEFIDRHLDKINANGIQVRHSGSRSKLPSAVLKKLDEATGKTAKNRKLVANFCLNYGSREEIVHAVNSIILEKTASGKSIKKISEKEINKNLYTKGLPDVDLMIRTSGEQRISNYLLWQSAYAELYFTETHWPEFNKNELLKALEWYGKRQRRFGGIK